MEFKPKQQYLFLKEHYTCIIRIDYILNREKRIKYSYRSLNIYQWFSHNNLVENFERWHKEGHLFKLTDIAQLLYLEY